MEELKGDDNLDQSQNIEKKKGVSKKFLVIIAIVILILAGGGFFAYSMLFSDKGDVSDEESDKKAVETKPVLFSIDPFVVNLTNHGRYLKITLQFELIDETHEEAVRQKIPNLRDIIITILSSKSVKSVSGVEGKFQLKDEILLRANNTVGKDVFKNLYFTDFVMQ